MLKKEAVSMGILAAVMVPHPPLIVPEIGRGEEEKIKDTIRGFAKASEFIAGSEPETVVIISPHSTFYSDCFHISPGNSASGDLAKFGAHRVTFDVRYDSEFVFELEKRAQREKIKAGTMGEREKSLDHATTVPLYFLKKAWGGVIPCRIVRIGLSGLPLEEHYRFGTLIRKTAEGLGRNVCVIASGDLSHVLKREGPYGYRQEGPEYDKRIMDVMSRAAFGELFEFTDLFCERAAECGHRSFTIMAGCFDGLSAKAEMLSYEGPFGVGYGVCTFMPGEPDPGRKFLSLQEMENEEKMDMIKKEESLYVRLARETVERYISTGKRLPVPEYLPEEALTRRAGTFVSLKKFGRLRGCIGTISATEENIAKEIIQNAVSAAVRDPRFPPVTSSELKDLVYSVDILGETEEIDSSEELDVKKYGVIVSNGYRKGLLLPNLEGIDSVDDQISIAMQKAGIRKGERIRLQRFEVVRYH